MRFYLLVVDWGIIYIIGRNTPLLPYSSKRSGGHIRAQNEASGKSSVLCTSLHSTHYVIYRRWSKKDAISHETNIYAALPSY